MADEAFDAFSQKRDTGTKARVTETKVVETATDPNRYRLPPNRRVRVVADQLDMTIDPEKEKLLSFAEGLNKVKPALLKKYTNQAIDENIGQVDLGRQAAMTQTPGELKRLQDTIDSKWFNFGANAETALKLGDDLSAKLQLDMANRPRNISYEDAYAAWWQENQPTNIDPQFLPTFNDTFMPNADKVKNKDIEREYELTRANAIAASSRTVIDTIIEANKNGADIFQALDAIKANEQALYHFDNPTWNEVKYFAITAAADELDDPRIMDVLQTSTFDQVTGQEIKGMAYTREWGMKIRQYREKLVRDNRAEESRQKAEKTRIATVITRLDTKLAVDMKMHIGDDGLLSKLNTNSAAQIRARSYLTVKDYQDIVERLKLVNKADGTAMYPHDDEEAQVELRKIASKEAIANATSKNWSNDELTKERQASARAEKNNEISLFNLTQSLQGREDLIKYYKYQIAAESGQAVPVSMYYSLPFNPSPELRKVAMKMGENENEIKILSERVKVLQAENYNRRQDGYGMKLESLTQQIEALEAQRAGLGTTEPKEEKTEKEIREKLKRDKDAEFPDLEEMFITEDGEATLTASANPQLANRYKDYKSATTALKTRASGTSVALPKEFKSWEEMTAKVKAEQEFFTTLSEKRTKALNKNKD